MPPPSPAPGPAAAASRVPASWCRAAGRRWVPGSDRQNGPMTKELLINLHTHLEGRVRPGTAAELAAAAGVPEPSGGWEQALQLTGPADLTVFLAKVAATYPFFGSAEGLGRIVSEAVQDAAA